MVAVLLKFGIAQTQSAGEDSRAQRGAKCQISASLLAGHRGPCYTYQRVWDRKSDLFYSDTILCIMLHVHDTQKGYQPSKMHPVRRPICQIT